MINPLIHLDNKENVKPCTSHTRAHKEGEKECQMSTNMKMQDVLPLMDILLIFSPSQHSLIREDQHYTKDESPTIVGVFLE